MRYVKTLAIGACMACATAAMAVDQPIYDLPLTADQAYYYRHVNVTFDDPDEGLTTFADHGYLSEVALVGDDIYLRDPITSIPTQSYIKGFRDGDEIVFPMPQTVLANDGLAYTVRIMAPNDWNGIKDEPEEQALVLQLDEDNCLVQKPGNGMLGLFLHDLWVGVGETDYAFQVFTDEVNNRPANVGYEEWNLIANGHSTKVEVAIKGDKIWIDNLYEYIPGSAICGTIADGKASFPSAQYLGIDFTYNYFTYFMPARITATGAYNDYEFIDGPLVFSYDAVGKELRTDDSYLINASKEAMGYIDNFDAPIIRQKASVGKYGAPKDPVIIKFLQYGFSAGANFGALYFDLPKMDVNGNVLDPENMAYNFYIDGELFTFRQDEIQLLQQDYVNVPYQLNNYFEIQGGDEERHAIFFNRPVKKVGVRSIFAEDYDPSTWHYSNIVEYVAVEDGLESAWGEAEVVSSQYYDLSGRQIEAPNGAAIRVDTYSDGTKRVSKTFQTNE